MQYRGSESRYVIDETTGIGRLVEMPAIFVDDEWQRLGERFEDWQQARDWRSRGRGTQRSGPMRIRSKLRAPTRAKEVRRWTQFNDPPR